MNNFITLIISKLFGKKNINFEKNAHNFLSKIFKKEDYNIIFKKYYNNRSAIEKIFYIDNDDEFIKFNVAYSTVATLIELGNLIIFDWAGDPDLLEEWVKKIEVKYKFYKKIDFSAIYQYADSFKNERGDYIGRIYGPLANSFEDNGFTLLDINTGSDSYCFFAAKKEIVKNIINIKLSRNIRVEHPGWQFKELLIGTPYERYATESARLGSDPTVK